MLSKKEKIKSYKGILFRGIKKSFPSVITYSDLYYVVSDDAYEFSWSFSGIDISK